MNERLEQSLSDLRGFIQSQEAVMLDKVVTRTWGTYEVIYEGDDYKVKILRMNPRSMTSLQRHWHRSERFITVSGSPEYLTRPGLIVGADRCCHDTCKVAREQWHQIVNRYETPAVIVEVQLGRCDEDDIERG